MVPAVHLQRRIPGNGALAKGRIEPAATQQQLQPACPRRLFRAEDRHVGVGAQPLRPDPRLDGKVAAGQLQRPCALQPDLLLIAPAKTQPCSRGGSLLCHAFYSTLKTMVSVWPSTSTTVTMGTPGASCASISSTPTATPSAFVFTEPSQKRVPG